jgi:hypothetical protein
MADARDVARIRAEALATIARAERRLAKQPSDDEDIVAAAEPAADWRPEDRVAKWKREGAEIDARRAAHKQHLAAIADNQRRRTLQYQIELARAAAPVITAGGQNDAEIFAGFEEVARIFDTVLDRLDSLERHLKNSSHHTEKTPTEHVDRLRYSTRIQ